MENNGKDINISKQGFPNYTLEELKVMESLSTRAYNTCIKAGLDNLKAISEFYIKHRDFEGWHNCGRITAGELKALVFKYFPEIERMIKAEKEHPNSIENLKARGEISDHTYYICRMERIRNLNDIVAYYENNWSFENLSGCGAKTTNELKTVIKKHTKKFPKLQNVPVMGDYPSYTLNELVVNNNLSERAFNILRYNGLNNLKDIFEFFYKTRTFMKIRNCGFMTNCELLAIIKKYKKKSSVVENIDVTPETIIQRIYQRVYININDFIENFEAHCDNKTLPVFKIIEIILTKSDYLDKPDKEIINNISTKEPLTSEELGNTLSLTKERIEYRKRKILYKLFYVRRGLMSIIRSFWDYADKKFILLKDNIVIIETSLTNKINSRNKTNFNHDFTVKVLSACNPGFRILDKPRHPGYAYLLKDEFEPAYINSFLQYLNSVVNRKRQKDILVSGREILLNNVFHYRNDYLKLEQLRKKLADNLFALLHDKQIQGIYHSTGKPYSNLHKKISKKYLYQINYNDLLNYNWTSDAETNNSIKRKINKYRKITNESRLKYESEMAREKEIISNKLNEYIEIFKIVAEKEFGLQFKNNALLLKQNAALPKYEYIIEVLNKFDRPMHAAELFDEVSKLKADAFSGIDTLRSCCGRYDEIICFGRTSTYGLKKWETEKAEIKGGTIREIVEQYLRNFNEPKHIDEITEHVNKYRNTNSRSVITNLKLFKKRTDGKPNPFKFFDKGYVGLVNQSS
ncbi:MAG: hypothetical protein ABR968_12580 [Bacteroidales bacterium]